MISFLQLTEMDAAWHDVAGALQLMAIATDEDGRLAAAERFNAARERYVAAKEGRSPRLDQSLAEVP